MPELPEVEVICRGLQSQIEGRRIIKFSHSRKKLRRSVPFREINCHVKGNVIKEIRRRAKYLIMSMEKGAFMIVHLGMTGRLCLCEAGKPMAKHDHLSWVFDNGMELRFNDTRRFGFVEIVVPGIKNIESVFSDVGPEPFWENFSARYLFDKSHNKIRPVKNFLLDSRVVAGIGNIYASEILFDASISPLTPVKSISRKQYGKIVLSTRKILTRAIECGGTTIADYVNSCGQTGYFQVKLKVYGREGLACVKCNNSIERIVMAGRSTFFCSTCQG